MMTSQIKPVGRVLTGGRHGFRFDPIALGISLWLLVGASGCAIHYRNPHTGVEQLWGFGQLRLQMQTAGPTGQLAVVTSGCRVPGLCLDVGRDHFGIALGYVTRQQVVIVASNQIAALKYPTNSLAGLFPRAANSRWAFGSLHSQAVGQARPAYALVSGRAQAGLGAGLGGGDTSLSVALDSRQKAVIINKNMLLEFDQDAPGWPGFDFFTATVWADSSDRSTSAEPTGEP